MTAGLAAGPFGDPDRFDIQSGVTVNGAFERPISHFRCNYIDVAQSRSWLPDPIGGLMWVGMTQADRTCFMPVHAGVTKMPKQLDHGDFLNLNLDCAWWVSNLVRESVGRRYDMAIKDVQATREALDSESFTLLAEVEAKALSQCKGSSTSGCANTLTRFAQKRTKSIVDSWRGLWMKLESKYLMNYLVDDQGNLTKLGYPASWLEKVGYPDGPVHY
jgi:dipeptidase